MDIMQPDIKEAFETFHVFDAPLEGRDFSGRQDSGSSAFCFWSSWLAKAKLLTGLQNEEELHLRLTD